MSGCQVVHTVEAKGSLWALTSETAGLDGQGVGECLGVGEAVEGRVWVWVGGGGGGGGGLEVGADTPCVFVGGGGILDSLLEDAAEGDAEACDEVLFRVWCCIFVVVRLVPRCFFFFFFFFFSSFSFGSLRDPAATAATSQAPLEREASFLVFAAGVQYHLCNGFQHLVVVVSFTTTQFVPQFQVSLVSLVSRDGNLCHGQRLGVECAAAGVLEAESEACAEDAVSGEGAGDAGAVGFEGGGGEGGCGDAVGAEGCSIRGGEGEDVGEGGGVGGGGGEEGFEVGWGGVGEDYLK